MVNVTPQEMPVGSLIAEQAAQPGYFTDCYACVVPGQVSLADYVTAFYTTPLFRAERLVLRLAARAPSTDVQARAVAEGEAERFAVWQVAARRADEMLLAERSGRTKSWFSVAVQGADTKLFFGSVVVPVKGKSGKMVLGPVFDSLKTAHALYSRALLASAARGLAATGVRTAPAPRPGR
ncbi:hypothetical protein [Pseudosulfitobacter koreensis]|uniref:Uncharacterized protein n=1 Tax=Pseudosulfitobacter koreensis TaxID=2968472 RepID=A0ABT1YZV6_9RHOB|nr:hypothetical protein [Pseudosulfitobacter koreense]MCR8826408.1 hypothetical protein [Pseudosulfitobacter koreense]